MDDSDKIRRILRTSKTLAVVGLSAQWHRPSFFAARYMQEHGLTRVAILSDLTNAFAIIGHAATQQSPASASHRT